MHFFDLNDEGHKVDIVIFSPILAYPREVPPNVRLIVLQAFQPDMLNS